MATPSVGGWFLEEKEKEKEMMDVFKPKESAKKRTNKKCNHDRL